MVRQALDAVCETFEGCETLAYADLSTQLVLATNGNNTQAQDGLNALCEEAALMLDGGHIGIVGTQTGFRLFLRDFDEPNDGLICLCTLQTDMDGLLPAARKCLSQIASGG
ncbi:hypothetical protein ACG74X_19160 [Marivita sp. S0852]|uniref:hypothetical protein n=1 Tax=Marivita sp. S0852 TaxID=3373893 RepID=UPI003982319A